LLGLACAGIFLAVALYHVPLREVGAALARTSLLWLGAAICAYLADMALRSRRWQMILRPTAAVPYKSVTRVLVVGYGLNTIMPLRLGELFRAEYLNKTCGVPRVQALTSIVVERLLDGLTVVACFGAGLLLAARTHAPQAVLVDVLLLGGALFGAVLVAALCLGGSRAARLLGGLPRLARPLIAVAEGFAILRTRQIVPVALMTLLIYAVEALSCWSLVNALGLPLGVAGTLVLLGAASLGTLLPSGPGYLGTLQFAYVLAIGFAGGAAATGIAAATLAQCCLMLPVAVASIVLLMHGSSGLLRPALARQELEPV
jgi:hypothetical protein